ncbi:DUF305 domain-containing protein [Floridanema aerugineum]|uniref:DUF305 domain-containing protein n=1 Tax=Floridaenema aerugineum BLCC-F46 TaxID=3153654 RepID=A0ABV4X0D0_9CYAN
MQSNSAKIGFLALILGAFATLGSTLTGCSTESQNQTQTAPENNSNNQQVQNTSATNTISQHDAHHGGMNHSMDLGPADANYDLRFIDGMRLHHRGAIAMAKEAQQKSKRPEIKQLAGNIIVAQNREENELLRKWRKAWYPQASEEFVAYGGEGKSVVPMSKEQQQMMAMQQDLGAADAQFDLRFMDAMIVHHEGALVMAQDALQKSKRPEIKKLSQEIITSQQKEIDQMKQWRKAWYQK